MSEFKNIQELEKRLWDAADELRANTGLTSQEYSRPVLGLIFLRYAEYRYELAKGRMEAKAEGGRRRRGKGGDLKTAIQAEGAMYVPEGAVAGLLGSCPTKVHRCTKNTAQRENRQSRSSHCLYPKALRYRKTHLRVSARQTL